MGLEIFIKNSNLFNKTLFVFYKKCKGINYKVGNPEEIGEPIYFLASGKASWIKCKTI